MTPPKEIVRVAALGDLHYPKMKGDSGSIIIKKRIGLLSEDSDDGDLYH